MISTTEQPTRFASRTDAVSAITSHKLPSFAAPVFVGPVDARATGTPTGWYVSVLGRLIDISQRNAA